MTPPGIDDLRHRLIDHRFPVGRTVVQSYEAWLGNDAMQAPAAEGSLGPMWTLVAGYRGMGTTIGEILQLAGSDPGDGIMFGELSTRHVRDLKPETEYTVECQIVDVTRKSGARTGVFDILKFDLSINDDDGPLTHLLSSFILPREADK